MTTTIPPHTADRAALDGTEAPQAPPAPEIRRLTSARTRADVIVIVGAALGGLSLAALLTTRLIPSANVGGFMVIAYLLFLVLYGVLVSLDQDGRTVRAGSSPSPCTAWPCSRCLRCWSSWASRSGGAARRWST